MKAIIIDDDPNSHTVLKKLLTNNHSDVNILGSGYSVSEGCELVKVHQPDLVFLDIELPDGKGFDLFKKLETSDFYTIFITAYKDYAVTAIKFGGLDFLIKPIERTSLDEALQIVQKRQLEDLKKQFQIVQETLDKFPERHLPTRIAISTVQEIIYKNVKDIIRMEASGPWTSITLLNEKRAVVASHNIGYYEKQFEPYFKFMKTHRSHLINLDIVKKYVKTDGGYLVMKNEDSVPVSRPYKDELLRRLSIL